MTNTKQHQPYFQLLHNVCAKRVEDSSWRYMEEVRAILDRHVPCIATRWHWVLAAETLYGATERSVEKQLWHPGTPSQVQDAGDGGTTSTAAHQQQHGGAGRGQPDDKRRLDLERSWGTWTDRALIAMHRSDNDAMSPQDVLHYVVTQVRTRKRA